METAPDQELTEHLSHEKNGKEDPTSGNVRNGTRPKTVLTEATGRVTIEVARDRVGSFEPQIVRKRQRRLTGSTRSSCCCMPAGLPRARVPKLRSSPVCSNY